MAHFPKPPEGSWTEHFPELGTDPVSFEDSISPEHYEREREAIFRRTWLNIGRVEQLTAGEGRLAKHIHAVGAEVTVYRDAHGDIRAFTGGSRGIRRPVTDVRCETWEGFVFVNFSDDDPTPLRDYLGRFAHGLEGYPFDRLTEVYQYRAEVGSNWKLYIDAFAEFYHAPILHAKQYVGGESKKLQGFGYESLHYDLDGPHSMQSAWGGMAPPKDLSMVKPIERALRSGNFGPWDRPDIPGLDPLPPGLNPARHRSWGLDSYVFFPNFMLVVWAPGWYLTYHYWPTAYDQHIFEGTLYFAPARSARDRIRQELAAVTFKEFGLQDCNTLEATQKMLETRAVTRFPLNDQEILIRHLHKSAGDHVAAFEARV
ncbi:RHO alpha subunit C-terminal catalytic domain-containing protein [Actinocorallia longicatena]|uniref:Aromatic ring-hydroxylating dioxygenase subunit alpha n=1 Tax=Actinocorallia longicatena TaxID=111803 RepID=A0ABP6QDE5_9ACTN